MEIKLSLAVLSSPARSSFFSYLDTCGMSYDRSGEWLTVVVSPGQRERGADKKILAAVYDAVVSIRRLDIRVEATFPPASVGGGENLAKEVSKTKKKSPKDGKSTQDVSGPKADIVPKADIGPKADTGENQKPAGGQGPLPPVPPAAESPAAVLRCLSLYFHALVCSVYTGFAPRALAVLAEVLVRGKGASALSQPGDDLIRYYSMIKSRAVVDLKMVGSPPPDLIESVSATAAEVSALSPKHGPSPHEGLAVSVAAESAGVSDRERVVVFQMDRDVTSEQKLQAFLLGHRSSGIYLKPLDDFWKHYEMAYRGVLRRKGFIEFSVLVSAGIDYDVIIKCMKDAGAVKREIVHQVDFGYNDAHPGKAVRVSEWYSLGRGRFQSVYDSRVEKIPPYLAVVDHTY